MEEEIREHLGVILGKHPGDIRESLSRLDALQADVAGHLAHYLAKRSYEKAWIWLEGGQPESGICGR
jgi:hypothetical protein